MCELYTKYTITKKAITLEMLKYTVSNNSN